MGLAYNFTQQIFHPNLKTSIISGMTDAIPPVDYNRIAASYDQRYTVSRMPGVEAALLEMVQIHQPAVILEAGCGTGHWLEVLRPTGGQVYGLDLSPGMLAKAHQAGLHELVCGRATRLPLAAESCDLIFCVNAIHHFGEPQRFIHEAHRLLRPGGILAITGSDHATSPDAWYVYDYFPGTFETDLQRFPSRRQIMDWSSQAGFHSREWQVVEQIESQRLGRDVFNDPFLKKDSTSQLALLSDEAYAAGMQRIQKAIEEAEMRGEEAVFDTRLKLVMFTAHC